jgi:hypothetical protein
MENFKNPQRVFSYLCSFHPDHFGQTQTGATVPLSLLPEYTLTYWIYITYIIYAHSRNAVS